MRILAVAGDAGGARALLPVIRQLRLNVGNEVECRAYAAAVEIWRTANLQPLGVNATEIGSFDRILLGTTVGPEQHELRIIRQAKGLKIRTVSVLDFGIHYIERFTTPEGAFILPDAIAVMDERCREEMIEADFPPECIVVTGQPAFDDLAQFRQEFFPPKAEAAGLLSESTSDPINLLYVSQPLSQLFTKDELGFDEREALNDIIATLKSVLEQRRSHATLWIKLHPRETNSPYALPEVSSSQLEIRLLANDSQPREAVLSSDFVIGMNSILLMEACLLGKPVVSYQPELRIPDPLPSNQLGWSKAVYRRELLEAALEAELFDPRVRGNRKRLLAGILHPAGSTARVVNLLLMGKVESHE